MSTRASTNSNVDLEVVGKGGAAENWHDLPGLFDSFINVCLHSAMKATKLLTPRSMWKLQAARPLRLLRTGRHER